MRTRWAAGAFLVAAGLACDGRTGDAVLAVAPTLSFPQGLLQAAATVQVSAYAPAATTCNTADGSVSSGGTPDATTTLSRAGCSAGDVWCGSMTIEPSSGARVFAAEADDATGASLARGCVQAIADDPSVSIVISMHRVLPAATCGDGAVEPTEQCDPPGAAGDLVCDTSCHSQEELVSTTNSASGAAGPGAPKAGGRAGPAIVWPASPYPTGRFVAFWTDTTAPPDSHVGMRVLGGDLDALPPGAAPALAGGSIWLTSSPDTTQFPSPPDADDQKLPAAVFVPDLGRLVVAFADDSTGSFDIALRTLDQNFTAGQPAPVVVNGNGGEPGVQTNPAVALGSGDVLYIVWQSSGQVGQGQIVGRTYALSTGTLGAQAVLDSGASNQSPTVAALSAGWVVAWQSGADIAMVTVGAGGQPTGTPGVVSAGHSGNQEHPSVASVGNGDDRFAIAWADHGQNGADVVVQRFDGTGTAIAGDASTPINDLVADGDQLAPVVAGSVAGAFFAVAWLDQPSGHVRGRYLDAASGFDFNPVTGQESEFQVSLTDGRVRANPAVAVGGDGPYVAFAWDDQTAATPGIYARRFPLAP